MVRAILERSHAGAPARRRLEQRVRGRAAALSNALAERGYDCGDAAQRLGLATRTLRQWRHDLPGGPSPPGAPGAPRPPRPLGRPLADSEAAQQQAAIRLLHQRGPAVGVPALRLSFPTMTRSELTELLHCYRRCWQTQHRLVQHRLRWLRPGTVWAMDFAEAPGLIDDRFPYLLAVRDLASGRQLLWRPVRTTSADVVIGALTPLFLSHGAPWVMKTDNGSAFIADPLAHFLGRWQVLTLFSPPRTPAYNGSIEAAIGSLKTRCERRAAELGHPGRWTGVLVEAARQEANAMARPRRLHGASPDEAWFARAPFTQQQREQFRATVHALQSQARVEKGLPLSGDLRRADQAAVDRMAIRRALVAHDLLVFRRKSIPAPIQPPKAASDR